MLVASALIYVTSFFLAERPNGEIKLYDTIPGLVFLDANLLNKFQNFVELKNIEGAFWSLYVEVKFYIIFGALYFASKAKALRNLILLFATSFLLKLFGYFFPDVEVGVPEIIIFDILNLQYFGWFCIGALIYKEKITLNKNVRYATAFLLIPAIVTTNGRSTEVLLACLLIFSVFRLAINNKTISKLFCTKPMLFFGSISYPLYLIHDNAMVAMTIKTYASFDFIPAYATPWPGVILITACSYVIAIHIEQNARAFAKKMHQLIVVKTR